MSCSDCLIWVGQSYPTVYKYIKEAEKRGCCRKVPTWPSWAVPGRTRVFLAHRDVSARTDTGSIFGYYLLNGVDVIFSEQDCQALKELRSAYGQSKSPEDARELVAFFEERLRLQRLPVGAVSPNGPAGGDGEDSRAPRRENGRRDRAEDAFLDFILDLLIPCEGPPGRPTGGGGGFVLSDGQTAFEEDRWCNGRELTYHSPHYTPSLYFVDVLCQQIDALFCALLKELVKKQVEKHRGRGRTTGRGARTPDTAVARMTSDQKTRVFRKACKEAAQAFEQKNVRLPKGISWLVERHGALFTFRKPYPIYQRIPQAAFKGLIRLDGDQLLDQVVSYYARCEKEGERVNRKVMLPICLGDDGGGNKTATKLELVNRAARELGMDTSLADDVFGWFAALASEELKSRGRIRLPDIGTLRVKMAQGNKQVKFKVSRVLRNKAAQGKKQVKFKVSRVLKDSVRNPRKKRSE